MYLVFHEQLGRAIIAGHDVGSEVDGVGTRQAEVAELRAMKDCVFVYRDVAGGREENVPGLDIAVDELGKRGNRGKRPRNGCSEDREGFGR